MPKTMERLVKKLVKGKAQEVSKEELEVAAYYHWLNRGCPDHDDLCDWVEAQKELAEVSH